jgi:hypothetical protein
MSLGSIHIFFTFGTVNSIFGFLRTGYFMISKLTEVNLTPSVPFESTIKCFLSSV